MSIKKLNECIRNKGANNSRAREAIYNLLLEYKECLNVAQISKRLLVTYPKKISPNTLYRHLSFFVSCGLVVAIQDDYKRAYYHIKENGTMAFCVCTRCNNVTKIEIDTINSSQFFDNAEFITVHKLCNSCKETSK